MREVRRYYLGSRCELTGVWGAVVMHHGFDSRRPAFNGFTGRPYSVFDGQLRDLREEVMMHFCFSAGNSEESWRVQERNNQRIFEGLSRDWRAGRELPFPPEVMEAIPKWLNRFPEWLAEFQATREAKRQSKVVILAQRRLVRERFPGASLKRRHVKRLLKRYCNQTSEAVLQAIACAS